MNLIVPAAGKSSRFPGMRPKWLLTHPAGNIMAVESIAGLNLGNFDKIYLVVLKEHLEQYKCEKGIQKAFDDASLGEKLVTVVLEEPTRNQPETVAKAIQLYNIKGPIFIKDTDNFFQCDVKPENSVSIFDLNDMELVHASNKSFVMLDEKGYVNNIVEKQVISSKFCTGGYSFGKAELFLDHYKKLKEQKDLYVSHIIFSMLLDDIPFKISQVENYIDWGTIKEWNDFKASYATIFIDLDGVLVENSGAYFDPVWGATESIEENVNVINRLYNTRKVKVIITTSRKSTYRSETIDQLNRLCIQYHQIIFDLPHCKRIIVNDYAKSNSYKSCDAINIRRNSSDLKEMIEDSLGINLNT